MTYVPARNTIFLSLALGLAEASGARDIFIGVNALDYSGYPDCRPEFIEEFERLANLATKAGVEGDRFTIHAPLQQMSKADIAREAVRLGLDAALSHSCYDPSPDGRAVRELRCMPAARQGFRRRGIERSDGLRMTYAVKECFLTLQGEGVQSGSRAVFLRFAGCNLWSGREQDRTSAQCTFCDTDFVGTDGEGGGKFATADDLAVHVEGLWGEGSDNRLVVITGGEPMLQLDACACRCIARARLPNSGRNERDPAPQRQGLDWICVSPKAGTEVIQRSGNELKLVWPQQGIEPAELETWSFDHFLVQPMDCDGARTGARCRDPAGDGSAEMAPDASGAQGHRTALIYSAELLAALPTVLVVGSSGTAGLAGRRQQTWPASSCSRS